MATNDFKPFATGASANVTSQTDWAALPALLSGFQSGKASSAQVNKALRQATFVAAALAQFVSDKSGQNVADDGNLAGFVSKLTTGFANQHLTRSNPFGDIKTDGAAAVSTALANLGLGEAAKRTVGTGTNQIPDMNSFPFAGRWFKQPNGWMIQVGAVTLPQGVASGTSTYPVPFPNACVGTVITGLTANGVNPGILSINNSDRSTYGWWRFGSIDATSATIIGFGY